MNDQDRFTREMPPPAAPGLNAPNADGMAGLPVFTEWHRQEFEKSPWPMRIFDHETFRYLAVNDAAVEFYGYTREEFLALTAKDTRHPQEYATFVANLQESTGYLRHRGQRRHIKRSGEVVVVEVVTQDIIFGGRLARLGMTIDVTGRLRTQELLWQRQLEFESLAENLPDLVARFDRDHRFVYVNSAVEKLSRRSRHNMIGKTQRELGMPAALVTQFELSLDEAIRTGEAHMIEFKFPAPGGDRLFEAHHVPEKDASGRIATVLCVARDITERKQAEVTVLRSAALAQLLESLARAANEAVTPEAAMIACLERICQYGRWVLGRVAFYDEDGPKNAPSRSVWHVADRGRFAEFIRLSELLVPRPEGRFIARVLRERSAVWMEDMEQESGFGRTKSALEHGLKSAFAFPVIVRGDVVAVMEFHSEEIRARDSLIIGAVQTLASQLARIVEREWAYQAHARMAAIVESSQDAIISRTLDGTILTWNPGAERLFGYTAAEIVGRKIEILYPPEIKSEMFRRQELLLQGLPAQAYETVRVTKDGRRVHVSTSPAPIQDSSGKVFGVSTIIRDITGEKQAESERIEHALRQRDALVREVHHRIKNNLQGVVGLLRQKIRKNSAVTPDIEECIAQLQSVALVYGLQETRPDGLLNLAEITDAICSSAGNLIGGRLERIFERQSQRPACVVAREAVSVAVALNELVINALKHQPARAGKKHVRISLRETADEAEIRIANRGQLPAGFDYHGGRAAGNGLDLVRTLLAAPGGTVTFLNGARGEVEVVLKLCPPLLAERQRPLQGNR